MKNYIKCKKHILISGLLILVLLIFTACGAQINTEMKIDKDFKGDRIITAYIKSADLRSYVSSGADGIEDVIKRYIPESLSYKRIEKNSGDVEFVFTINFNNLKDYTNKIVQILNKNPDNTIKANILYDNKNNEFNKNLMFEENFSSSDLLAWLVYGLKTENIVKHSSVSDWMETGKSLLKIENQDYNLYGNFKVKKSESTSFDSINVLTEITDKGSYKRSITFIMNERNVRSLKNKGLVVADYLKKLSPVNAKLEESKVDSNFKYIISFESETTKELSSKTDKLFNSKDSVFTIKYSSYEENKNTVRVDVDEYIDASYYFNNDGNKLESDISLYENMFLDFTNTNNSIYIKEIDNRQIFRYSPNFYDVYNFTFSFPIKFKNASLNIDINNNKLSEKLALSVSGNLPDPLTEIIEANIKSSIESDKLKLDVKNEKSAITYTLSLNGNPEELTHEFKSFLSNYTGNDVNHEILYSQIKSKSAFKTEHSLSVVADLQKLNAENIDFYCKPSNAKKFEIVETSNIEELENSTNKSIASKVNGGIIRFYAIESGTKQASIFILALSIIVLAVTILFIISNRERLKGLFKNTNIKKKTYITTNKSTALTDTNEEE